jgi:hypothetical protein
VTLKAKYYRQDVTYTLRPFKFHPETEAKIPIVIEVMLERVDLPEAEIFDALRFIPYFQQPILAEEDTEHFLIVGSLSHFHYIVLLFQLW